MKFEISSDGLTALASVGACASTQDNLAHLTGVYIVADHSGIESAATDRFRLAVIRFFDGANGLKVLSEGSVLIPAKELQRVAKAHSKARGLTVTVSEDGEFLTVADRENSTTIRTLKGFSFPDRYRDLLPAYGPEGNPEPCGTAKLNVEYLATLAKLKPWLGLLKPSGDASNHWRVFPGKSGKPWLYTWEYAGVSAEFLLMPIRNN